MLNVAKVGRYVQGFRTLSAAVALVTTLSLGADVARAGYVTSGESSGVAISSNLTITTLASADLTLNSEQGTAPSAYSLSQTNGLGATISAGAYNLPILGTPEVLLSGNTGLLDTSVASNIDGGSTTGSASASTTVDNLNLKVLSTLGIPVLNIGATTLSTSSSATGSYGSLTAGGTPTIEGLSISVLGIDVTALVKASAGALVDVSALTGVTGLEIGIDMVTTTGDGILNEAVTTDNIVVEFNNVLSLGGTINGSLVIGQSTASITSTSVPEPASVAMMGVGFFLAVVVGAGRRQAKGRLAAI